MDQLPGSNILSPFFFAGKLEEEKFKRFERLAELFTWLAVILGLLILQLPFAQDLNKQAIYIIDAAIGVYALVWYRLIPKKFSGRLKMLASNLITITFIAFIVHNTSGVQGYLIFLYFLAILSSAMTQPIAYMLITVLYVEFLIFLEAFLTAGAFEVNISLAVLHSWALLLVVFFARFNAGEASLLKKRQEEVILGRERALGELKDEFVYIISHELKQPATAIKGYLATLFSKYSDSFNTDTREIIELTNVNSGRLSKLLDDLLDISQIQKGSLKIKMTDVSLRPVISEVLSSLLLEAQNKRISLVQKGAEEMAAKADADRLKEVLTNLVGNAVKYTPEGGKVIVEVKKEGGFSKILVSDNGVGISEGDQKHLFEKFYRVENEKTEAVKGSGLGLFITKQLVEKMGGQIGFTSNVGEGTTFYFTLPRYRW
ncbi:MAG TPA: ATP-binding protein [Candidatus Nanoarchaeia archaeon]